MANGWRLVVMAAGIISAGCASTPPGHATLSPVRGTVVCPSDADIPRHSLLSVRLIGHPGEDAQSVLIAEQRSYVEGDGPFPYELSVDWSRVAPGTRCTMEATVIPPGGAPFRGVQRRAVEPGKVDAVVDLTLTPNR